MGYASPDHQSQQGGPACAQTVKTDAPSGGAHTIRAPSCRRAGQSGSAPAGPCQLQY
jgi:hypothetical protein